MSLYDRGAYTEEVFFDEVEVGKTFPSLRYRIGRDDIAEYLESVDDDTPAFLDDAPARAVGFEGAIVPPFAILNYGFVYQAMRRRPPTGNLNTSCEFSFLVPVHHGDELTLNLRIADKYEKRGRNYVRFEAIVNSEGTPVAKAIIDLMFPDRPDSKAARAGSVR